MNKTLLITRHEFLTTLRRRSFQVVSLGLPIFGAVVLIVISIIRGGTGTEIPSSIPDRPSEFLTEGIVDQAGLIEALPVDLPLVLLDDEDAAQQALINGEVNAYYVVPTDYIQRGEVIYVHPELTPMSSHGQEWMISRTLMLNLIGGDVVLTDIVWSPMEVFITDLSAAPSGEDVTSGSCTGAECASSIFMGLLPLLMVVMLFMFITLGAGMIIRNITTEKQDKLIEIVMLSVSPRQMLTGKLIGLGAASFLASLTWLLSLFLAAKFGGSTLQIPTGFSIPASLIFWAIVFFLLGYALYASLMAGAGALVPKVKDITNATWVVITPLMAGYLVGVFIHGIAPHGALAIGLSLFPLTAPVLMVMRLTVGGVPIWQLLLSVGLMIATTIFIVRLVARTFRAQSLLSGEPFSARKYFAVLLDRA
ncbi:MAG TPA: ABC transporter permease [Anaerolineae bacterium]|nr:ABC transporter permease [Anaerolineae bacterium]